MRCILLFLVLFVSVQAFIVPGDNSKQNGNNTDLEFAENEECRCENGRCVTDKRGKMKCACNPKHSPIDDETCKPCDCGAKGKCIFQMKVQNGKIQHYKMCVCDKGSAEKDGRCVDCHCGLNSLCEFEGEEKLCYCEEGYSEKKGVCTKCDCGENSESCSFEGVNMKCDCLKGYAPRNGICRVPCNYRGDNTCSNGGDCVDFGEHKFCDCKPGVSGDLCEIVDDCEYQDFCGLDEEAECVYDGIKGGTCKCHDSSKLYNPETKECQRPCESDSDCLNGGVCKSSGGHAFCTCKSGTSGDLCEIVNDCSYKDFCGHGNNVECVYDGYSGGLCKCRRSDESFDPSTQKCRVPCRGDCANSGECVGVGELRFCKCKNGTSGDHCATVDDCKNEDFCGRTDDVKCVYDGRKGGICKCKDSAKSFHTKLLECRIPCRDDCKNGGECADFGSHFKLCKCREGTRGDLCETVDDCIKENFCGKKGDAYCMYDGSKGGFCACKDSTKAFHSIAKECRIPCRNDCKNGGKCVAVGSFQFCSCREGTRGDLCEIVDDCIQKSFCGYKGDAYCAYDGSKGGTCICKDSAKSFHSAAKECRRTCHNDADCGNGGNCKKDTFSASFCECHRGYQGELCEVVTGCIELGAKCTKAGGICVFDRFEESKASCVCGKDKHVYDRVTGRCQPSCINKTDCGPDGACVNGKFCYCKDGYEDVGCRNITGCKDLRGKCDLAGATCVFDGNATNKAICQCRKDQHVYDPVSGACKPSCINSINCGVGGICRYRTFCDCKDGYEDVGCRVITGCKELDPLCAEAGAKCVFDGNTETKAKCLCDQKQYVFDKDSRKCRPSCSAKGDCGIGGTCVDGKYCVCKEGFEGVGCGVITGCKELERKCSRAGGKCIFDESAENKATCLCYKDKHVFDLKSETCIWSCENNDDCDHGGTCSRWVGGVKSCNCLTGTSGDKCNVVDECETGRYRYCRGKNGTCLFDVKRRASLCECDDDQIFDQEKNICKERTCTESSCRNGRCDIIKGKEVCSCFEGYKLEGNECRKQICSNKPCINGTCIVRNGNIERCICPAGYTLVNDTCKRGICRVGTCYGGTCETIDGELVCVCPPKFHLRGVGCYETQCETQRCYGGECVVKGKEEICTCLEGYILVKGVCKKILCRQKSCFGGQCNIVDGREECTCPDGYSIYEDVCRLDRIRH